MKGTYVLVMQKEPDRSFQIQVGSLGEVNLEGGWFLYVGSAFGPGGLRSRLKHHCQSKSSHHWHIDYLLDVVRVEEIWYTEDPQKREEEWASALRASDKLSVPVRDFGSMDCCCESHLFQAQTRPRLSILKDGLLDKSVDYRIHTLSHKAIKLFFKQE